MVKLSECKQNCLCVDCKNKKCMSRGDIGADCPKYKCDNDVLLDCKHCEWIKEYVKEYRKNQNKC